ncbi:MAG: hypothetical protein QOD78_497 [Chloroflexota bacterium]|nr:hypothetical protein [Chloroflexota bacterium]
MTLGGDGTNRDESAPYLLIATRSSQSRVRADRAGRTFDGSPIGSARIRSFDGDQQTAPGIGSCRRRRLARRGMWLDDGRAKPQRDESGEPVGCRRAERILGGVDDSRFAGELVVPR